MKNFRIFDQNHGLTPQETSNLVARQHWYFYSLERPVFYLEHHQTSLLAVFQTKIRNEKFSHFWPKSWTNSSGNIQFDGWVKLIFSWFKKGMFSIYLEHHQTSSLSFFSHKHKKWKILKHHGQTPKKTPNLTAR